MKLKEIEEFRATDLSTNQWLREIALQLAKLNEGNSSELVLEHMPTNITVVPQKRGPGRPRRVQ